jgi:H+/Cl- antiporter ClcA
VTLFKGLDEMQQLAFSQVFSVSDYLLFAVIKLAALVVAAACGFRGGRIFPAVFVGVALGLMLHDMSMRFRRRLPSPALFWGWFWWSRATPG